MDNADLGLLSNAIWQAGPDQAFDLNRNSTVEVSDMNFWVRSLKKTSIGDANLDLEFTSRDLVQVFQEGQYEDLVTANSAWGTGDWNFDLEFDSRDLILAFQDLGYEVDPLHRPPLCLSRLYLSIRSLHDGGMSLPPVPSFTSSATFCLVRV